MKSTLSSPSISETARHLTAARRRHRQWDAPGGTPALRSLEECYAVQDAVARTLGARIAGWKTSAPDPRSTPIAAPIFASLLHRCPTEVRASDFFVIGIEGEIAFRMKHDLPRREEPYSIDDIIAATGELIPAIEIVDTRIVDGFSADPLYCLADNQSNGGLVIGEAIADWKEIDLSRRQASVTVNGKVEYESAGRNRAGDLFRLMAWLANHQAGRRRHVRQGDVVTTGTYTGMIFVEPGAEVVVEFPGIGRVEVAFSV